MSRHEPIRGDIANLYPVGQGLLKVARDPADNDLMLREAIALALLRDRVEAPFLGIFEEVLGAPVVLRFYGPTVADKRGGTAAEPAAARRGDQAARRWSSQIVAPSAAAVSSTNRPASMN